MEDTYMPQGYRIVDLTHCLEPGMPMTRSLPRFGLWWHSRHSWGDKVSLQAMLITEHTGTNVDAPRHVVPDGKTLDDLPLDAFMGPAVVLDLRHVAPMTAISAEDIQEAEAKCSRPIQRGEIVLLMTGFDDRGWETKPSLYDTYLKQRPTLSVEAAEYLIGKGIKALGSDTHGPDASAPTMPLHSLLLGEGVILIEALSNLTEIQAERCLFIGLPLKITGGTGSPVRAIAVTGDLTGLLPQELIQDTKGAS
jgi:kynurenine formamidase